MPDLENIVRALTGAISPKLGRTSARIYPSIQDKVAESLFGKSIAHPDIEQVYMPAWLKHPNIKDQGEYFQGSRTYHQPYKVTTKVPEAARNLEYDVPTYHSTTSYSPFDEFRLPTDELGIHAGTPKSALDRARGMGTSRGSVMPLLLRATNPIESPDLGTWRPNSVGRFLYDALGWKDPTVMAAKDLSSSAYSDYDDYLKAGNQLTSDLRDLIKSKGYDSFRYVNKEEDPGSYSWMVLHPSQVRLPWAKFDPSKVESGNIYAGIAGGAIAPSVVDLLKQRSPEEP
jgi:hypothetical protein